MGADFYQVVIWSFIVLAASEAIYGLRQLYGFTSSHHSLYSLTGSFFNPGPYSDISSLSGSMVTITEKGE